MGQTRVIVVGAGAFGGWTALSLRRRGAEVTLIDAWGPGHVRASSGGPTRVLRLAYPDPAPLRSARRARDLWIAEEARSSRRLFQPTGLLWMTQEFQDVEQAILTHFKAESVPFERLDRDQVARAYPQVRSDDLAGAILEPGAGYLLAAEACRVVAEAIHREGGTILRAWAEPGTVRDGRLIELRLSDGSTLEADAFVFAGGPWLPKLFPDLLEDRMIVTRQETFTFGTSPRDTAYTSDRMPIWAWHGDRFWYGIPGDGPVGGFKVADDTRGPDFDPTDGSRLPTSEGLASARSFVADRFPGLADAPLIEARVCQYTNTPDGRFLADRPPGLDNLWILGGGSGHGFKHGPTVGEDMARVVLDGADPDQLGALQPINQT